MIIRNRTGYLMILLALLTFSGCRSYEKYVRGNFSPNEVSPKIKAAIHLSGLKNRVFEKDSFMIITQTAKIFVTQDFCDKDSTNPDSNILDINPTRFYELVKVISGVLPEYQPNTQVAFTGYPKFRILEYEENSSLGLKLLAAWTMGIPCLFGMPANSVSTFIRIQTEWMDDSGNMISSHQSQGFNKTYVAMYWGYGADARKRSNMSAIEEALWNSQH
jgi:hypothetical protein